MKRILLLGALLMQAATYAQNFVVQNIEHTQILYRGYNNQLLIGRIGSEMDDYQIEGSNCDVQKLENGEGENLFIVKPNAKTRCAAIRFLHNGELKDSIHFLVQNLPSPSIYWGNQQSGSYTSTEPNLIIKYPLEIRLQSSFEIVSWRCVLNKKTVQGTGNILSQEILDFTRSLKPGEEFSIILKVKGEDGIYRELAGVWEKE